MAANIYAKQMSGLGYGHALWEPNPGKEYRQVEIGDVGFVRAGFFHRLFNILLPGDHPSQKWGVPEYYEPLRLPFPDYKWNRHPLRGHLHSTSVKVLSSNLSANGVVTPGSARVSFGCTRESGAALVLPEDAVRQDAHFGRWFREYCLKHYATWRVFANDTLGFDLEVSDLILVTGRDLTTQWGMAAFARSEVQGSVGVGVSALGMITAEFEVRGGWRTDFTGGVQHRWGPRPSRLLEPELVERGERGQNQCVFLRGYRVKERRFLTPKAIKAASKPSDLDKDNRGSESESVAVSNDGGAEQGVEVEQIEGSTKDVNLLDPILDYILNESNARVAIAHDEDLWPYLRGLLTLSPETAVIKVDDNDVGRILPKPGSINLRPQSVPRGLTTMESIENLTRSGPRLTLRPSQASLATTHPRRSASDPWPLASSEKSISRSKAKKSKSLAARIGTYFRQRSLRRTTSNPDFAATSYVSYMRSPTEFGAMDGMRSYPESTSSRRGQNQSARARRLSTIMDAQEPQREPEERLDLPDEYRLDLPPPYELDIPEQYQYR